MVGLRDANLSLKLQMVADLNLEKAVTIARQSEAIQQQQGVVSGEPGAVDIVDFRKKGKKVQNRHLSHAQTPPTRSPQKQTCTRCDKSPAHSRQKCLAINETCHKYNKRTLSIYV